MFQSDDIVHWIRGHMTESWFYYTAIVGRFGFGIMMILAAEASRFPQVIKVLGYVTVVAALVFLFVGQTDFTIFIDSLLDQADVFGGVSGLMSILAGGLLIYAFSENTTKT